MVDEVLRELYDGASAALDWEAEMSNGRHITTETANRSFSSQVKATSDAQRIKEAMLLLACEMDKINGDFRTRRIFDRVNKILDGY